MYHDLDVKIQDKIKKYLVKNEYVKAKKLYTEAVKKLTLAPSKVK
jgi:hypothetical protein